MKYTISFIFLLLAGLAYCQPGRGIWTNSYGTDRSSLRDVYVCEDGGYVAAGSSGIQRQYWDVAFVVKTDANGRREWEVFLDLFEDRGVERLSTIIEADNGDFVVGGNAGNQFIGARLNNRGDLIWAHVYGGERTGWCSAIIETKAEGFLFGGSIADDQAVVMTDGDGEVLWQETYDGGAESEYIGTMREVEGIGYFFAGMYGNVWTTLTKITGPGDPEWRRFYESEERRIGCDQLLTVGNRFYLAGQSAGNNGNECALFLLDREGNVVWDRFHVIPYITAVMGATRTVEDGVNFVGQYTENQHSGAFCFGVNHSGDSLSYQRYGVSILLSIVTDHDGFSVGCGSWMRPAYLLKMNPVESPPVIISKCPRDNELAVLLGDTIQFSVEGLDYQGDQINYCWTLNQDTLSLAELAEIIFSETGIGEVKCVVSDEAVGDSALWHVTVTDLFISAYSPDTLNLSLRRGDSVDFALDTVRATEGIGDVEYQWTKSFLDDPGQPPEDAGRDASVTISFLQSGNYAVEGLAYRGEASDAVTWNVQVRGVVWSFAPEDLALEVLPDSLIRFEVIPSNPEDSSLSVRWFVDNELAANDTTSLDWGFFYPVHSVHNIYCVLSDSIEADTVSWTVTVSDLGVKDKRDAYPTRSAALLSVSPNPFNSTLTIRYSSPINREATSISIHDISGREVADLSGSTAVSGGLPRNPATEGGRLIHPAAEGGATKRMTAERTLTWDASIIPAGVYFVRLQSGTEVATKKVVLMR